MELVAGKQLDDAFFHLVRRDGPAWGDAREDVVAGGWFTEGVTRMDDQQHALSALLWNQDVIHSRTKEGK